MPGRHSGNWQGSQSYPDGPGSAIPVVDLETTYRDKPIVKNTVVG
jgi:hypothetical protein